MTTQDTELCEALKRLGFSVNKEVTLYGEALRLVSDPMAQGGDHVFIDAIEMRTGAPRHLRIPLNLVQNARKGLRLKARKTAA